MLKKFFQCLFKLIEQFFVQKQRWKIEKDLLKVKNKATQPK